MSEKKINQLQRRLGRSKFSIFLIIGFLALITYLLIVVSNNAQNTMSLGSEAGYETMTGESLDSCLETLKLVPNGSCENTPCCDRNAQCEEFKLLGNRYATCLLEPSSGGGQACDGPGFYQGVESCQQINCCGGLKCELVITRSGIKGQDGAECKPESTPTLTPTPESGGPGGCDTGIYPGLTCSEVRCCPGLVCANIPWREGVGCFRNPTPTYGPKPTFTPTPTRYVGPIIPVTE